MTYDIEETRRRSEAGVRGWITRRKRMVREDGDRRVEEVCEIFHDAYEAAAVEKGWETQERSRVPWADVPAENKETMRATVRAVLASGVVQVAPEVYDVVTMRDGSGAAIRTLPNVDERLLWMLRVLADEFGALGVLQTVMRLWPELTPEELR